MRSNLEQIQRIEDYLLGNLNTQESELFAKEIASSAELAAAVETQQLLYRAIKRKALREAVVKHKPSRWGNKGLWTGLILVLAASAAVVSLNLKEPASSVQSQAPTEQPSLFESITKSIEDIVTTEEADTPKVEQTDATAPALQDSSAEKKFDGLNYWEEPTVQKFTCDAAKGGTFEGAAGTLIVVPSNAFLSENGEKVDGEVSIELVEALTLDKMILYNLTTTSNGKLLETGGMVHLDVKQNEKPISIKPDRAPLVQIPTKKIKPEMLVFDGKVAADGNINWENPKELEKFLVPVDFSTLDFLPPNFRSEMKKLHPKSIYFAAEKNKVDSVYYSLSMNSYETINYSKSNEVLYAIGANISIKNPISTLQPVITNVGPESTDSSMADSSYVKGEEAEFCGIDPLAIKALRGKSFEKTYIATKEFEARLKALHGISYSQPLLDIYTNSLSKPMWYADSLVATKLNGKNKTVFESFAKEKLTNVPNSSIYQKQLTAYYNKKRAEFAKQRDQKQAELKALSTTALQNKLAEINRKEALDVAELVAKNGWKTNANSMASPSVANNQAYMFSWSSNGWKNIDCYISSLGADSKRVDYTLNKALPSTRVYQWLNTIATITPLTMGDNKAYGLFPAQSSSAGAKMKETYALAIGREKDVFYWGYKSFNPYTTSTLEVEIDTLAFGEIKAKLIALGLREDIKHMLKTQAEELKEQLEIQKKLKQQQKVYTAFATRMRKIELEYANQRKQEIAKMQAQIDKNNSELTLLLATMNPCLTDIENSRSTPELIEN